jgi:hypothetical protein
MQGMPKLPVEIKGLAETLKAMRQFEPDLEKNLNKEVRAFLTPVVKQAQAYVPSNPAGLRNWTFATKAKKITQQSSAFAAIGHFPKFNAAIVKRGIKVQIGKTRPNKNGFSTFYRISNTTAAGAIMETAGRKHPAGQPWNPKSKSKDFSHSRNPKAGEHFVNSMGGQMKGAGHYRGRLIYRAWNENEGKALAQTIKAVETTILQFHRRAQAQVLRKVA